MVDPIVSRDTRPSKSDSRNQRSVRHHVADAVSGNAAWRRQMFPSDPQHDDDGDDVWDPSDTLVPVDNPVPAQDI